MQRLPKKHSTHVILEKQNVYQNYYVNLARLEDMKSILKQLYFCKMAANDRGLIFKIPYVIFLKY